MAKVCAMAPLERNANYNNKKGAKLEIVFGVSTIDKKRCFFVEYEAGSKFLEATCIMSVGWEENEVKVDGG